MSAEFKSASFVPTVHVGGFPTAWITRRELAAVMVEHCRAAMSDRESWAPKLVFSSNGQGVALAGKDKRFRDVMRSADIVHADGMPIVFASRRSPSPLPERISTTDFFHDAAKSAVENGLKFFFLGAQDGQNAAAADAAERLYPGLQVVGRHHGYFAEEDDRHICELVRDSGADVLWVALGKPRQEFWCVRNRQNLKGVGWVKTCGGLFSFLAGDAPRAPEWMQAVGLEWLHRTAHDPRRLAWRYLTTNPYALYRLARYTDRPGKVLN